MHMFNIASIARDEREGGYTAEVLVSPPFDSITPDLGILVMQAERQDLINPADKFDITERAVVGETQHLHIDSRTSVDGQEETLQERLRVMSSHHRALSQHDPNGLAQALGVPYISREL